MRPLGYIFQDTRSKIYRFRYADPITKEYKVVSLKTRDKKEAEKSAEIHRNKLRKDISVGVKTAVLESQLREIRKKGELGQAYAIENLWPDFNAHTRMQQTKDSTKEQYKFQIASFVQWFSKTKKPLSGDIFAADVTKNDVQKYYEYLLSSKKLTVGTALKHIKTLQFVYKLLKEKIGIDSNPFSTDEFSTSGNGVAHKESFSQEQINAILSNANGEMRTLVLLGIYTGLRLKDCALLKWDDVNLENNEITVLPAKTARYDERISIPIHPDLLSSLKENPKTDSDFVLPKISALYERRRDYVSSLFTALIRLCGIAPYFPTEEGRRKKVRYGFHSFRHTFVSLLASSGTPPAVIMKMAGHRTTSMSQLYTHMDKIQITDAIMAMPSVYKSKSPSALTELQKLLGDMSQSDLINMLNYAKQLKQAGTEGPAEADLPHV